MWTIVIVLLLLWLLGLASHAMFGGFIHVLLLLATVLVFIRVLRGPGR